MYPAAVNIFQLVDEIVVADEALSIEGEKALGLFSGVVHGVSTAPRDLSIAQQRSKSAAMP